MYETRGIEFGAKSLLSFLYICGTRKKAQSEQRQQCCVFLVLTQHFCRTQLQQYTQYPSWFLIVDAIYDTISIMIKWSQTVR